MLCSSVFVFHIVVSLVVVCLPPVGGELSGGVVPDSGGVELERGLDGRLDALAGCTEALPCGRDVNVSIWSATCHEDVEIVKCKSKLN